MAARRRSARSASTVSYQSAGDDSDDDFNTGVSASKRPRDRRANRAAQTSDRPVLHDQGAQKRLMVAIGSSTQEAASCGDGDRQLAETSCDVGQLPARRACSSGATVPPAVRRPCFVLQEQDSSADSSGSSGRDEWTSGDEDWQTSSRDTQPVKPSQLKPAAAPPRLTPAAAAPQLKPAAAAPRLTQAASAPQLKPAAAELRLKPAAAGPWLKPAAEPPQLEPAFDLRFEPAAAGVNASAAVAVPGVICLSGDHEEPVTSHFSRTSSATIDKSKLPGTVVTSSRRRCSPVVGLRLGLSRNVRLKPLHPVLQLDVTP